MIRTIQGIVTLVTPKTIEGYKECVLRHQPNVLVRIEKVLYGRETAMCLVSSPSVETPIPRTLKLQMLGLMVLVTPTFIYILGNDQIKHYQLAQKLGEKVSIPYVGYDSEGLGEGFKTNTAKNRFVVDPNLHSRS